MNSIDRNDIGKLLLYIEKAENISIVTHLHPDGDAIGSCIAMLHFLGMTGKSPVIVTSDAYPEHLKFMTDGIGKERLLVRDEDKGKAEEAIRSSDLIFCLDFNAFHRTGMLEKTLEESSAAKILIDHHLHPSKDLFDLSFSETEISSTAEYLFHILKCTPQIGGDAGNLPAPAATAMLTGMTTDTNNFANSVFPSTLRMTSELLEAGTDRDNIIHHLYNEYREDRVRLMGYLLSENMKITRDGVAYIILDSALMKRYNIRDGETEGFVNIPLSIKKVKLSCLLKEDTDKIRVSLRSKKGISANRCAAEYFHGGGHELAAGGRLDVPDDIPGISGAAEYIEDVTHRFMTGR